MLFHVNIVSFYCTVAFGVWKKNKSKSRKEKRSKCKIRHTFENIPWLKWLILKSFILPSKALKKFETLIIWCKDPHPNVKITTLSPSPAPTYPPFYCNFLTTQHTMGTFPFILITAWMLFIKGIWVSIKPSHPVHFKKVQ